MEINKKSQLTVIEISFVLLLIGSYLAYLPTTIDSNEYNLNLGVQTLADSLLEDYNFRSVLINEDLSSVNETEDWSQVYLVINSSLINYELKIGDLSTEKTLKSCSPTFEKLNVVRIVSIDDSSIYDFRYFILGVCY